MHTFFTLTQVVECGAAINIENKAGLTPLTLAAYLARYTHPKAAYLARYSCLSCQVQLPTLSGTLNLAAYLARYTHPKAAYLARYSCLPCQVQLPTSPGTLTLAAYPLPGTAAYFARYTHSTLLPTLPGTLTLQLPTFQVQMPT